MSFSQSIKWVMLAVVSSVATAQAGPVEDAMNADRAFSQMAQDKSIAEAFGAYAAPNAIKFGAGEQIRGPVDIAKSMKEDDASGAKLIWEPKEGVPSGDGSQVVVWGRWTYKGPAGSNVEVHGTYLTVWAKQPDGSWKYTHDIGNADPKPKPKAQ
jgi:ketosteroid isomerase-like protein